MTDRIAILILTGGQSDSSSGPDPLLALVDGQDLLSRVTQHASETGIPVFVTIATKATAQTKAISTAPVTIIPVAKIQQDMSIVLRAGMRSLPDGLSGVLIMPAEMPGITREDLNILLTHFAELGSQRIVCATDETGHPGHPVILPSRMFRRAARLNGNQDARSLLLSENVSFVRLANGHARTDQDRPEGWVSWRAGRRRGDN